MNKDSEMPNGHPTKVQVAALLRQYETELFEHVIPFWERYSRDGAHGGYFNCLDRDGTVYDTNKHVWLQGRQAWLFSKLYRTVEQRPGWLAMAAHGIDFLRTHAIRDDSRVYFELAADGKPVYLQRKIFSECFYIMALAEYSRATDAPKLLAEATDVFERVWSWAYDWTHVGRSSYAGAAPAQMLAVPMILLNLIEELTDGDATGYAAEVDTCIAKMLLHIDEKRHLVLEHVAPDGSALPGSMGRLLNPGHAIEAGWFLQHWAQRLKRPTLASLASNIVRRSFQKGWDKEHGGIYYFLDADGYSPTQLEWPMKLWWPHCEALYAHALNFVLTQDAEDWAAFKQVHAYTFAHFPDPLYGEWYGYLDREGRPTHRFKGGPYKGCFHVPRALLMTAQMLSRIETTLTD